MTKNPNFHLENPKTQNSNLKAPNKKARWLKQITKAHNETLSPKSSELQSKSKYLNSSITHDRNLTLEFEVQGLQTQRLT